MRYAVSMVITEGFILGLITGIITTLAVTFINALSISGRRFFVRKEGTNEIESVFVPEKKRKQSKVVVIDTEELERKADEKAEGLYNESA